MTAIARIASPSGWTDVDESDLPLAISISADGAAVFGADAEANAAAWLGAKEGHVFVQPVDGEGSVRLNRAEVGASFWLSAGDQIEIGRAAIAVQMEAGITLLSPVHRRSAPALAPPDAPVPGGRSNAPTPSPAEPVATEPAVHAEPPPKANPLDAEFMSSPDSPVPEFRPLLVKKKGSRARGLVVALFAFLVCSAIAVVVAAPVRVTTDPVSPSLISSQTKGWSRPEAVIAVLLHAERLER